MHPSARSGTQALPADVLDATFDGLGCRLLSLRQSVENVVKCAEHGDRRIVSWSEHDREVVTTLREEDPDLVERFERRYANARAVAERWINRLHREVRLVDGRLATYLAYIQYEIPPNAPSGQVGETIRILRPILERSGTLTARQQERWTELLEHNRYDCAGMRAVCLRAARELDAAG